MTASKFPNNKEFAIVLALPYQADPAGAVYPIPEWVGVVLSGEGDPETNKPKCRLPEVGDTTADVLGIVNSGTSEALCGDFPSAAESHISVVELGHYLLKIADGETIAVGDGIALNANGEGVALTTGIVDTTWIAVEGIAVSDGHYIKVALK